MYLMEVDIWVFFSFMVVRVFLCIKVTFGVCYGEEIRFILKKRVEVFWGSFVFFVFSRGVRFFLFEFSGLGVLCYL